MLAHDRKIWRSTDRGASWSAFSSNFTTNRVTSVAQSTVTVANMMAASSYYTTTPDIDKSTNEGATWTDITTGYNTFLTANSFSGTNIQRSLLILLMQIRFILPGHHMVVGKLLRLPISVQHGQMSVAIYH